MGDNEQHPPGLEKMAGTACPNCARDLLISKTGWYTCESCEKPFFVEADDHALGIWQTYSKADAPGNAGALMTDPLPTAPTVKVVEQGSIEFATNWRGEFTKVDAEQRIVTGKATQEVIDRQDDLIPLQVSQDAFAKFAQESGAIREMHQPKAIGRLVKWWVDPSDKSIGVEVYLSKSADGEDALTKVKEGILRGFSIGGKAVAWQTVFSGGRQVRKITKATIRELSLVDVPANPGALVTLWKVDGINAPHLSADKIDDTVANDGDYMRSPDQNHLLTLSGDPGSVASGDTYAQATGPYMKEVVSQAAQLIAAAVMPESVSKVAIPHKEGEPQTPPKGYPKERGQYADPANYSWPVDTAARCKSALSYFNGGKGKDKYKPEEWDTIGRKIARACSEKLGADYAYDSSAKEVHRKGEEKPMKKSVADLAGEARSIFTQMAGGGESAKAPDQGARIAQLQSIFDVLVDQAQQAQNSQMPGDASTAAQAAGAGSMTNEGPEQTSKCHVDLTMPKAADPGGTPVTSDDVTACDTPMTGDPDDTTKRTMTTGPGGAGSVPTGKQDDMAMSASMTTPPTKPGEEETTAKNVAIAYAPGSSSHNAPDEHSMSSSGSMSSGNSGLQELAAGVPEMNSSSSSSTQKLDKGEATVIDQPLSTTPPTPSMIMSQVGDGIDQNLPAFISALMNEGNLAKAQKIAGWQFDDYFAKAQRAILNEGGWKLQNLGKINQSIPNPYSMDADLNKALNLADLPNVYLIRLAKLMLPVYAGLRRRFPQTQPPVGSNQATWRAQLGLTSINWATAMATAERNIGQQITDSFLTYSTPFRRIALNDTVSLEAVAGARGYDDPLQVSVIRALTGLLIAEERKILGDNVAAIGVPAAVTVSLAAAAAGLPARAAAIVRVSALTYRGFLAGSTGGAGAVGETNATASAPFAVLLNQVATVTWPAVPGAVAYNVFFDNGVGLNAYVATVTVNSITISAEPAPGNAPSGVNVSANAAGFEGIVGWCGLNTVYGNATPNKTFIDQAAQPLTTYQGGIEEFDALLQQLWTNWQIAPSLIVTSPGGVGHLTKQILSANNPAIYRLEVSQERGTISGGAFVTGYVNKFAPYADGTPRVIDIMAHPYLPNGTFNFLTESIPYPMAREARGFAIETLIPYTYFPLAQTEIAYPFSMLCSETLECFHPGAQAAIVGVDVTA